MGLFDDLWRAIPPATPYSTPPDYYASAAPAGGSGHYLDDQRIAPPEPLPDDPRVRAMLAGDAGTAMLPPDFSVRPPPTRVRLPMGPYRQPTEIPITPGMEQATADIAQQQQIARAARPAPTPDVRQIAPQSLAEDAYHAVARQVPRFAADIGGYVEWANELARLNPYGIQPDPFGFNAAAARGLQRFGDEYLQHPELQVDNPLVGGAVDLAGDLTTGGVAGPLMPVMWGMRSTGQGYRDAAQSGASMPRRLIAGGLYGAGGVLASGVPMNVVGRAAEPVRQGLRGVIGRAARGAVEEGLEEATQQAYENVAANVVFDPSRDLMQGVPESFAAGALGGVATSAGGEFARHWNDEKGGSDGTQQEGRSQAEVLTAIPAQGGEAFSPLLADPTAQQATQQAQQRPAGLTSIAAEDAGVRPEVVPGAQQRGGADELPLGGDRFGGSRGAGGQSADSPFGQEVHDDQITNPTVRAQVRRARAKLGKNLVVVAGEGRVGGYDPDTGKVIISVDPQDVADLPSYLAHELTHRAEQLAPDQTKALDRALVGAVGREGVRGVEGVWMRREAAEQIGEEAAELPPELADYLRDPKRRKSERRATGAQLLLSQDPEGYFARRLRRLIDEDPSMAGWLKGTLDSIFSRLIAKATGATQKGKLRKLNLAYGSMIDAAVAPRAEPEYTPKTPFERDRYARAQAARFAPREEDAREAAALGRSGGGSAPGGRVVGLGQGRAAGGGGTLAGEPLGRGGGQDLGFDFKGGKGVYHFSRSEAPRAQGLRREFAGTGSIGEERGRMDFDASGRAVPRTSQVYAYLPGARPEHAVTSRSSFLYRFMPKRKIVRIGGDELREVVRAVRAHPDLKGHVGPTPIPMLMDALRERELDGFFDSERGIVQFVRDIDPDELHYEGGFELPRLLDERGRLKFAPREQKQLPDETIPPREQWAPPFKSKLREVIEQKVPKAMPADQLVGVLRNAGGIKWAELQATKVAQRLGISEQNWKDPKQPATSTLGKQLVVKDELLDFLGRNYPDIAVEMRGEDDPQKMNFAAAREKLLAQREDLPPGEQSTNTTARIRQFATYIAEGQDANTVFDVYNLTRAERPIVQQLADLNKQEREAAVPDRPKKWENYVEEGGHEGYHEQVTRARRKIAPGDIKVIRTSDGSYEARWRGEIIRTSSEFAPGDEHLVRSALKKLLSDEGTAGATGTDFAVASHWEGPNVEFWWRATDRKHPETGGKVLAVEEGQSDIHGNQIGAGNRRASLVQRLKNDGMKPEDVMASAFASDERRRRDARKLAKAVEERRRIQSELNVLDNSNERFTQPDVYEGKRKPLADAEKVNEQKREFYAERLVPPDAGYRDEAEHERIGNLIDENYEKYAVIARQAKELDRRFYDKELGADEWQAGKEPLAQQLVALDREQEKLTSQLDEMRKDAVPGHAPFRGAAWMERMWKQILRYAAENGYEGVAWTTGDMQARRWSIGTHVGKIRWDSRTGRLEYWRRGYETDAASVAPDPVKATDLPAFLGDELAAKVVERSKAAQDGTATLEGDDIPEGAMTGREGKRRLYDKQWSEIAKSVAKKAGLKVELSKLPIGKAQEGAKEYVVTLEGGDVERFDTAREANDRKAQLNEKWRAENPDTDLQEWTVKDTDEGSVLDDVFDNKEDAQERVDELNEEWRDNYPEDAYDEPEFSVERYDRYEDADPEYEYVVLDENGSSVAYFESEDDAKDYIEEDSATRGHRIEERNGFYRVVNPNNEVVFTTDGDRARDKTAAREWIEENVHDPDELIVRSQPGLYGGEVFTVVAPDGKVLADNFESDDDAEEWIDDNYGEGERANWTVEEREIEREPDWAYRVEDSNGDVIEGDFETRAMAEEHGYDWQAENREYRGDRYKVQRTGTTEPYRVEVRKKPSPGGEDFHYFPLSKSDRRTLLTKSQYHFAPRKPKLREQVDEATGVERDEPKRLRYWPAMKRATRLRYEVQGLRERIADLKEDAAVSGYLRDQFAKLVRENVPRAARADLLTRAAQMTTDKDFAEGLDAAVASSERYLKRTALRELRTKLESLEPERMAPAFRDQINAVLGSTVVSEMSGTRRRRLEAMVDFAAKNPANTIPPDTLKAAREALAKHDPADPDVRHGRDMSVDEIDALHAVVSSIEAQDKLYQKLRVAGRLRRYEDVLYRAEHTLVGKRAVAGAGLLRRMFYKKLKRDPHSSALLEDPRKGWIARMHENRMNGDTLALALDNGDDAGVWGQVLRSDPRQGVERGLSLFYEGQDAVAQVLDTLGLKPGSDKLAKWAAETVDLDVSREQTIPVEGGGSRSVFVSKQVPLTRAQRIDLAGMLSDPETRPMLQRISLQGAEDQQTFVFTPERQADFLKTVTSEEQAILDAMKGWLNTSRFRDEQNRMFVKLEGRERLLNDGYWPRRANRRELGSDMPSDARAALPKLLEQLGQYQERVSHGLPFVVGDAFGKFRDLTYKGSIFAHQGENLHNIWALIGNPEIQRRLTAAYGRQVNDQLGELARAATAVYSDSGDWWSRAVSSQMGRAATALLSGPKTVLKQLTGIPTLAAELGPVATAKGVAKVVADPSLTKTTWEKLKLSGVLRDRYEGASQRFVSAIYDDPRSPIGRQSFTDAVAEAVKSGVIKNPSKWLKIAKEYALDPLQAADYLNAVVAFHAAKSTGLDDEAAALRASQAISRTQNASTPLDYSGMQLVGKSNIGYRLLSMFSSQNEAIYNLVAREAIRLKHGKTTARRAAFNLAVAGLSASALAELISWAWDAVTGFGRERHGTYRQQRQADARRLKRRASNVVEQMVNVGAGPFWGRAANALGGMIVTGKADAAADVDPLTRAFMDGLMGAREVYSGIEGGPRQANEKTDRRKVIDGAAKLADAIGVFTGTPYLGRAARAVAERVGS